MLADVAQRGTYKPRAVWDIEREEFLINLIKLEHNNASAAD